MKLTDRAAVRPEVITRRVGDEAVILDVTSGVYFGLNGTGARVWQLLTAGMTLAAVCEVMAAEYETGIAELQRDVLGLARELSARGLISVTVAPPTTDPEKGIAAS